MSLAVLTACSPLALLSFFLDASWAPAVFAGIAVVFPIALMCLGAVRGNERPSGIRGVAWTLWLLLFILSTAMAGLFGLRGHPSSADAFFFGLPAAAALLVYGLFLVPLVISTLGYALTFDLHGLDPDDLDDLHRRFERPEHHT